MMVEIISNQFSFDMFRAIIISISTQKIRRSGAFSWEGQIELQIRDRILTLSLVTLSALPVCFLGSSSSGSFWPFTLTHECHIHIPLVHRLCITKQLLYRVKSEGTVMGETGLRSIRQKLGGLRKGWLPKWPLFYQNDRYFRPIWPL